MSMLLKGKVVIASLLFTTATVSANVALTFNPQASTVEVGSQITVRVVINDIIDLYKYDLSVGYNANCITPIKTTEGSFLKATGSTTPFVPGNNIVLNGSQGEIHNIKSSLIGNIRGAAGSGELFAIQFMAVGKCEMSEGYLTTFKQSILGEHGAEPAIDYAQGLVTVTETIQPPCVGSGCGLLADGTLITTGTILVDDEVYVWGFRGSAQQGNGVRVVRHKNNPAKVNSLKNVVSLTSGAYHILALDAKGDVWGWGQSIYGETGCPQTYVDTPCKVLSNATQIAAGEYYSIALDANGQVWTWGHNLYGQLGDGGRRNSKVPVAVNLRGEKARLIGGAYEGAFVVTQEGHVWGWGDNEASGLGVKGSIYGVQQILRNPVRIPNLDKYADKIVKIAGGNGWGEALLDDGRVIGWGLHAAIGQGTRKTNISSPEPVLVLENVSKLFARYVGSMALTTDGKIYTWGQTGGSAFPMVYGEAPTLRSNTHGTPVAIGGAKENIYYQNDLGEIYGVGYNDLYKLNQSKCCGIINWPGSKITIK